MPIASSLVRRLVSFTDQFPQRLEGLWSDIQVLADKTFEASSTDELQLAWHHLVMAVGNFKRQSPIHLFGNLPRGSSRPSREKRHLILPRGAVVDCENQASWRELEGTGVRLATATAILASLWPDRHAIMDWHTRVAAVALVGLNEGWLVGTTPVRDPDSREKVLGDWDTYAWFRETLLDSADIGEGSEALADIERGLFVVHTRFWDSHPEAHDNPWREYGRRLANFATRPHGF